MRIHAAGRSAALYNAAMKSASIGQDADASGRRIAAAHCGILLAVVAVVWAPRLRGPIDLRYDAGVYYVLGSSLAGGKGYRLLNEPGEIPAIQYPPLLPLAVATCQRLLGTSDPGLVGPWLRYASLVVSTGYILLAYAVARRLLPPWWALFTAAGSALHFWFVFLSDLCFAEIPFALITMGFLLLTLDGRDVRWGREGAAALLGAASFFLRTTGVTLLAAWVLAALANRRFRVAGMRFMVTAACVLGWQAYVAAVRGAPSYRNPAYAYQRAPYQYYNVSYAENLALADPYDPAAGRATAGELARRTASNLIDMPAALGETVSIPREFWYGITDAVQRRTFLPVRKAYRLGPIALGLIVVAGLTLLARRRRWLVVSYVALTVLLIAATPWPPQFLRYTAPIAPLLFVALVEPLRSTQQWAARGVGVGGSWIRRALPVLVFGIPAAVVSTELHMLRKLRSMHNPASYVGQGGERRQYRLLFYNAAWQGFDAALSWLARNAQPEDIVVTSAPHWTYLRAGLRAVQPPFERDPNEALQLMESVPARYVIVDTLDYPGGDVSRRYAAPAMVAAADRWTVAFEAPGRAARVYRRREDPELPRRAYRSRSPS
jgi:hypothetical protein